MNRTMVDDDQPAPVRATYCDLASGRTSVSLERQQGRQRQEHQEEPAQR